MRAAEAIELEMEVRRLRDENTELKRRVGEVSTLEAAKKKADTRAEQLEAKVSPVDTMCNSHADLVVCLLDGGGHRREGCSETERTQRNVRRKDPEL